MSSKGQEFFMNTYKAVIRKITPRFELKVMVELDEGIWHGETLAVRGTVAPDLREVQWRGLPQCTVREVRGTIPVAVCQGRWPGDWSVSCFERSACQTK